MRRGGKIHIETGTQQDMEDWVAFRQALWPHTGEQEHRFEVQALIGRTGRAIAFLARTSQSATVGFAEATLRNDYVNGCATSPVAFLEGIHVHPDWRKRGIARLLCQAVERWAVDLGCSELASDTSLQNTGSQRMHTALDFEETERVVFYRKQVP